MNELELGTQYFFALLREDEETIHAVTQQVDELSKSDVFDFINYISCKYCRDVPGNL